MYEIALNLEFKRKYCTTINQVNENNCLAKRSREVTINKQSFNNSPRKLQKNTIGFRTKKKHFVMSKNEWTKKVIPNNPRYYRFINLIPISK